MLTLSNIASELGLGEWELELFLDPPLRALLQNVMSQSDPAQYLIDLAGDHGGELPPQFKKIEQFLAAAGYRQANDGRHGNGPGASIPSDVSSPVTTEVSPVVEPDPPGSGRTLVASAGDGVVAVGALDGGGGFVAGAPDGQFDLAEAMNYDTDAPVGAPAVTVFDSDGVNLVGVGFDGSGDFTTDAMTLTIGLTHLPGGEIPNDVYLDSSIYKYLQIYPFPYKTNDTGKNAADLFYSDGYNYWVDYTASSNTYTVKRQSVGSASSETYATISTAATITNTLNTARILCVDASGDVYTRVTRDGDFKRYNIKSSGNVVTASAEGADYGHTDLSISTPPGVLWSDGFVVAEYDTIVKYEFSLAVGTDTILYETGSSHTNTANQLAPGDVDTVYVATEDGSSNRVIVRHILSDGTLSSENLDLTQTVADWKPSGYLNPEVASLRHTSGRLYVIFTSSSGAYASAVFSPDLQQITAYDAFSAGFETGIPDDATDIIDLTVDPTPHISSDSRDIGYPTETFSVGRGVAVLDMVFPRAHSGYWDTTEIDVYLDSTTPFLVISAKLSFGRTQETSTPGFSDVILGGAFASDTPATRGSGNAASIAVNGATMVVVGANGLIKYSTDGGATWNAATSNTGADLLSVRYYTSVGFIACGTSGTVLSSSDGIVWSTLPEAGLVTFYGTTYSGVTDSLILTGAAGVVLARPKSLNSFILME